MYKRSAHPILFPGLIAVGFLFIPAAGRGQFSDPASQAAAASSIPQSQLIQPAEMVRFLQSSRGVGGEAHPLVFQVGSRLMFAQAHIPGSQFAGPGSQSSGLQLLARMVASTPKDKLIVLYCGCCPWTRCPNIGPAYRHLHDLGFTNVKAVYIANNFGDDWVAKGYPVDKAQ
jgi:thiosulfate/3-mercaptopyruvate sulfurtransferase